MFDKTMYESEDDYVNEFLKIEEQCKSMYESYCNHCDGEPLSYDDWQHTDTSDVDAFNYDDLPF